LSKIYNTPIDTSLSVAVEMIARMYVGQGNTLIDVYYNIYQLLSTGEDRFYFALKPYLLTNSGSISKLLRMEVSVNLENHCHKKLREGDEKFGTEIIEIYHFLVKHEMIFENGEVAYTLYKNVVTTGVDHGDLAWVDGFAEKYKAALPKEFREDTYNFCQAYILFSARRYQDALRIVMQLRSFHDFGKLAIKTLTARIQYELGMYDQLYILLDSFSYLLNLDTIDSSRKGVHLLFVKFMKEMMDLSLRFTMSDWIKISEEITGSTAFTHQNWFMDKMDELKEKHSRQKN